MLSEQQLKELATKLQSSFANVAREYAQNLFLSYFYAQEKSAMIFFKGGTALRLLYRSPRFSEDLDFSTPAIHQKTIEDLLQETLLRLEREGFQVDIKDSAMTTGGFLGIISTKIGQHQFDTSLEISGRKKNPKGELIVVENPYIDSYPIMSLKKDELVAEKIEALLNRGKPRDFFDLYFMLRANLLPQKAFLKKAFARVEETKINFKKELGQFLPQSHQGIIKDFKKTLESEIKRFL